MVWDDVVALAQDLPGVELSTSYGTPALKVGGKLLTRLRPEDMSLVLTGVPVEERGMLIDADPRVFHTTPHYDGYPIVLARLDALAPEQARSFLLRRWREVAPKRLVESFDSNGCADGRSPAAAKITRRRPSRAR